MLRRILLFLMVNIVVTLTISAVLNIFHIGPYLTRYGIDMKSLAIFCLLWGMGGAIISLLLSRKMAKWLLRIHLVDKETQNPRERLLLQIVENLSDAAHLPFPPQVGIYHSREVNAFATGPSKKRALIAVSSTLLEEMSHKELEGVIGHELAHISGGDMVTMTLIQGVTNAFVMFLARILAFALMQSGNRERRSNTSYYLFTYLFEVLFMILGSIVIAFFSRTREFRADRGGAKYAGQDAMISALTALQKIHSPEDARAPSLASMKISRSARSGLFRLFSTHPPLDERIHRLQNEPL